MSIPNNTDFANGNGKISTFVVRLLLQQGLILNAASDGSLGQGRTAQVKKLAMFAQLNHRDVCGTLFHEGVTAIGVHHPDWSALTHQVLEDLLRIDGGLVLINPSDTHLLNAETKWLAPASMMKRPVRVAANCNEAGPPASRSIILTCHNVTALADPVSVRARMLSRRGWRVVILCDDATMLRHRHRDHIDRFLQTQGITPWVLKQICQRRGYVDEVFKGGFLASIAPDHLDRSWKPGITSAALKIILEEVIFPQDNGRREANL